MSKEFLNLAQSKGVGRFEDGNQIAEDKFDSVLRRHADSLATVTGNNIGLPAGLLVQTMTQAVEILLQKRTAEDVIGAKSKALDWELEKGQFPIIENTGSTNPYSDVGEPRYVGMNAVFQDVGHYRFSAGIMVGDLEVEQYARAKINYVDRVFVSAATALAIEFNRTAFNGFLTDGNFLVYGILNSPDLNPYETISKTWDTATFEEIKQDITKILAKLTDQTKANVNTAIDSIRISIPSDKYVYLASKANANSSVTLLDLLKQVFPNLTFVASPDLKGAYTGNKDVLIAIAENSLGGTPDSALLGYSEIGRMSRIEQKTTAWVQKMSSGTTGFLPFKPTYIVRAQGI